LVGGALYLCALLVIAVTPGGAGFSLQRRL